MEIGNIHPIIVHFPIALLTLYSVLELLKFDRVEKLNYLFYIKAFMVIVGGIGATAGVLSGLYTHGGFPSDPITTTHSWWAYTTAGTFGILAVVYGIEWLQREHSKYKLPGVLKKIHAAIYRPIILFVLAAFGLICVTITGSLGGLMVHGPDNDPMTKLLFQIFFSS